MTGERIVRLVVLAGCLAGAVVSSALAPAPAVAASQRPPLVLHLQWRIVTRQLNAIATSDRYLALLTYPNPNAPYDSGSVILRDQFTNTHRRVALPSACQPNRAPVGFGGPYLVVSCFDAAHWLYNLKNDRWVPVTSNCPADCNFVGVGRYWLKFVSNENPGCLAHCAQVYFLQNLQSGQVEPDPATPGGTTVDDLNSPSGTKPLCAPLRYPTYRNTDIAAPGAEPGSLEFSGKFAIATTGTGASGPGDVFHLERCGSRLAVRLGASGNGIPPFLTSRAIAYLASPTTPTNNMVQGFYLKGLRAFRAALPKAAAGVAVAGLTDRTIYVRSQNGTLWAANVRQPPRAPGR